MQNTMILTITSPEHSGKTALAIAIARLLESQGIEVMLPPDPQQEQKRGIPTEQLLAKMKEKGIKVMIMESSATYR